MTTEPTEWVMRWKSIPGFSRYEASNDCRIRQIVQTRYKRAGNLVQQHIGSRGYPVAGVRRDSDDKLVTVQVHRLVALAFHGLPKEGQQVAHGDGKKTNNRPENLRWCSPKENIADMKRHGTCLFGAKHQNAKWNDAMVLAMRERAARRVSINQIAAEFNTGFNVTKNLLYGKDWRHIPRVLELRAKIGEAND